jgi:hypothetical protein
MANLLRTLELLRRPTITGEQTRTIDLALSIATGDEIPDASVSDVLSYIDAQLVHNSVSQRVSEALSRLQNDLRIRNTKLQISITV